MMERIYFLKKGGIENDGENIFLKRWYGKLWRISFLKKEGIENDGENKKSRKKEAYKMERIFFCKK